LPKEARPLNVHEVGTGRLSRPHREGRDVQTLHLKAIAVAATDDAVDDPARRCGGVQSTELQTESRLHATELPCRVPCALHEYRTTERSGSLLVTEPAVADSVPGPTPANRRHGTVPSPSSRAGSAFHLITNLLGEAGTTHRVPGSVLADGNDRATELPRHSRKQGERAPQSPDPDPVQCRALFGRHHL
jgi:hypothetical protein